MEYRMLEYEEPSANPKVSDGFECAVCCPRCGEGISSLHHRTVKVFNRDSEDEETGTYAEVRGTKVETRRNLPAGNPSRRRDGVVINFDCEQCGSNVGNLCVAQHKGATFIYWELDS